VNLRRLVSRSVRYYWRTGIVVVFGLAVATAVIVGSLVIGDSVRGSIRDRALGRLGSINCALTAPNYFRAALAPELEVTPEFRGRQARLSPLILSQGAARSQASGAVVPHVAVLGVEEGFWSFYRGFTPPALAGRQVAVNAALAGEAGITEGDYLLLTLGRETRVPTDSLFARRQREDAVSALRVQVTAVLADAGAGGFRLDAAPATPRNVFISRQWLAERLDRAGMANSMVAEVAYDTWWYDNQRLEGALWRTATLDDYGLRVRAYPERGYLSVESEGVVMPEYAVRAARNACHVLGLIAQPVSVYVADNIRRLDVAGEGPSLAYAVVAGVDNTVNGFKWLAGRPAMLDNDGLLLNAWAAEDLGAEVGQRYTLTYLRPTFEEGYRTETIILTLRGIVDMTGLGADRSLTPDFEGITDAQHMNEWDSPFPVDMSRITDHDEEYWDLYRAAPKAFVSLETARKIWTSGVSEGQANFITSVRLMPKEGRLGEEVQDDCPRQITRDLEPSIAGLTFRPVREQALEASKGTSDFSQLFLGMSMFLVLSGAGLAGMLMRLSADRRASEAGIMMACGFRPATAARTVFAEGAALTVVGVLLGAPLGILYAWGIIHALSTWWHHALGATTTLWLCVSPVSVIAGVLAGLVVGLLSVGWAARGLGRRRVLELLTGWQAISVSPSVRRPAWAAVTLVAALTVAAALIMLATAAKAIAPQIAFFGSGAALLAAGLAIGGISLARAARGRLVTRSAQRLALRNAAASPGRSLLVLGLLACATFVVVAVASNSQDFSRLDVHDRSSGAGGFSLLATSSVPLGFDFGTREGRKLLGFAPEDEAVFKAVEVVSFLASPGEDISCLNIARASLPRILGVSEKMIARGGFRLSTVEDAPGGNPWRLLGERPLKGAVPAFGDAASVRWQLHSGLGQTYPLNQALHGAYQPNLRFVGLLSGSIFQSELLVAESEFRKIFPEVDAPSYFLIATPPGADERVAEALRVNLGEMGLQVRTTREVLNDYIGVQNTYLSMFLALGGLGLLLGTVGMVAVLLRSALERRGEFALMLATGFTRGDLERLLVREHGGLLLAGMAWGALSALVAVAPQLSSAQSQVNWTPLVFVLISIPTVGLLACDVAARSTVRGSLIEALREE